MEAEATTSMRRRAQVASGTVFTLRAAPERARIHGRRQGYGTQRLAAADGACGADGMHEDHRYSQE